MQQDTNLDYHISRWRREVQSVTVSSFPDDEFVGVLSSGDIVNVANINKRNDFDGSTFLRLGELRWFELFKGISIRRWDQTLVARTVTIRMWVAATAIVTGTRIG